MTPEIKSAVIQVLGGAIFGGLIAYFAFALQRRRKVLEYTIFSMPLLRFTPEKQRNLSLAVDQSVLTGKEEGKGILVPISNAFGFEVEVLNMGNQEVVKPSIEVSLHESAKIIEYETRPISEDAYNISVHLSASSSNVIRIIPPYINNKERFLVRLISTDNANLACNVKIRGLGIVSRPFGSLRKLLTVAIPMIVPITSVFLVNSLFPSFFTSLGVVRETVMETRETVVEHTPRWLLGTVLIFCFGPALIAIANLIRYPMPSRQSRQDKTKELHWDVEKKKA